MKFIIRDMLFPTKLISLINTRGLIDSASLENHHNNRRSSGSHTWSKSFHFPGAVYKALYSWCFLDSHGNDYTSIPALHEPQYDVISKRSTTQTLDKDHYTVSVAVWIVYGFLARSHPCNSHRLESISWGFWNISWQTHTQKPGYSERTSLDCNIHGANMGPTWVLLVPTLAPWTPSGR